MSAVEAALAEALARARAALDGDDAPAAARALEDAVRACEAAGRAGERLAPAALEALRALHEGCTSAAALAQARLGQALGAAGSARRAAAAYRS